MTITLSSQFLCPTGQRCANGFLTNMQFRNVFQNGREMGYLSTSSRSLIPGMNFTCNGKITDVTIGGRGEMLPGKKRNQRIKLRIWKENATEPGVYHKSDKAIVLEPSICQSNNSQRYICQLSDRMQVSVERGDILGIEVPPRNRADFELYSVSAPGLTNYIFSGTDLPPMVNLCDRINETEVRPLIMLRITRMDQGRYIYQQCRLGTLNILITGDSAGQTTSNDQSKSRSPPGNNASPITSPPSRSEGEHSIICINYWYNNICHVYCLL